MNYRGEKSLKSKEIISGVAAFIVLFVFQMTIVPLISVDYIAPNFLVLFLLYYSLRLTKVKTILLGFFIGLLYDFAAGGVIGASAFSMTVTAYLITFFPGGYFDEEKFGLELLFVAILSGGVYSFFYVYLAGNVAINIFYGLFFYGLLSGIYTAVFAIPFLLFGSEKLLNE